MREVENKTAGAKSTTVDPTGDVVTMRHTTLHKASGKHYELTTVFDFTGVSEESRTRMAAEMLLIRWRSAFKNAEAVTDAEDNQRIMVAAMLSKSRKKLSSKEKLARLGLSKDEILALLEQDEGDES